MRKRHRWKKQEHNGKFSSSIVSSECIHCGCLKSPLSGGFEYILNGRTFLEPPVCDESLFEQIPKEEMNDAKKVCPKCNYIGAYDTKVGIYVCKRCKFNFWENGA